jgi:hypothetical protein
MKEKLAKVIFAILPFLYVLIAVIPFGYDLFNGSEVSAKKIGLFIVVLVIAIVAHVTSHYYGKTERAQNDLSIEILKSEKKITQSRYDMIYNSFKEKVLSNEKQFNLNYDPNDKIASILASLGKCFEKYLNVKSSYVSVSVFFHFDFHGENDEWKRLDKDYYPAYDTNRSVIFDSNSFGNFLINDGTEDFYLLNNKYRDGVKKGRYKLNKKDEETKKRYNRYGSIMGTKMIVKVSGNEYIRAILTLSTYRKKIDSVPFKLFRRKLEEKIENCVLPLFAVNVESELMQLYLQEKME